MCPVSKIDIGGLVPPGELESCVQDWKRDASTWRAKLFARHQPASPDVAEENQAKWEEIAIALEGYFAGLPEIKHCPGRGVAPRSA